MTTKREMLTRCMAGRGELRRKRDELRERLDVALAALESVEWVGAPAHWPVDNLMCPWCMNGESEGHADDCPRQAALAKARGDEGANDD